MHLICELVSERGCHMVYCEHDLVSDVWIQIAYLPQERLRLPDGIGFEVHPFGKAGIVYHVEERIDELMPLLAS
jgi:hypothetical protein